MAISCQRGQLYDTTPGMQSPPDTWIRVLLFDNTQECTLNSQGGYELVDSALGIYRPIKEGRGKLNVRVMANKLMLGRHLMGRRVEIRTLPPHVIEVNGNKYRGHLTLAINDDAASFHVINHAPMEAYLAGVVGAEMPVSWEREALRAQAIASRTYALFIKRRFGSKRGWDVRNTEASQVYKGIDAESSRVWNAVLSTQGMVLECPQEADWDIFPTYFHSTSGGHTENSRNVFGDSYPALCGVDSPYCKMTTRPSVFYWPMAEFSVDEVSERVMGRYPSLKNLGRITDIQPNKQSDYEEFSRVTSFRLIGENGQTGYLRGEDLRLSVDPTGRKIRSVACKVMRVDDKFRFYSGRGFGHGVGMSQHGAQGMALQGNTAEQILTYYYPESRITRLY